MRTAYLGWEANSLQNSEVQSLTEIVSPIVLHGFEFSLSMMHGDSPGFGQSNIAVVLFQAAIAPTKPGGWVGGTKGSDQSLRQIAGSNQAGIGPSPPPLTVDAVFAATSFRLRPPGAVNQILRGGEVDLNLPIAQGSWLALQAGHSGLPVDFEFQGVLYFEG